MNDSRQSPEKRWLNQRLILLAGVIVLLIVYVVARPALENLLGMELPAVVDFGGEADGDANGEKPSSESDKGNSGNGSAFKRTRLNGDRFATPNGLVFNKNRLDHVMRHAKDLPERDQRHGVFDADTEDQVLQVLDQAYGKVVSKSRDVKTSLEDGRSVHTVNMKRRIGYEGGRVGKQRGNKECRHLRLVLDKKNVITAFPLRQ